MHQTCSSGISQVVSEDYAQVRRIHGATRLARAGAHLLEDPPAASDLCADEPRVFYVDSTAGSDANNRAILRTVSLLSVGLLGLFITARLRHRLGRATRLTVLCVAVAFTTSAAASADDEKEEVEKPTIRQLVNQLSHADKAEEAIKALS